MGAGRWFPRPDTSNLLRDRKLRSGGHHLAGFHWAGSEKSPTRENVSSSFTEMTQPAYIPPCEAENTITCLRDTPHRPDTCQIANTLLINPGAVHRAAEPTVATMDTETNKVNHMILSQ